MISRDPRLMNLSAELRRITESPYTPSLQNLHDALQNADDVLLLRWARGNACQIDSLAAAILEGLELWPYALDILKALAFVTTFRDAVLRQKPMLLDYFVNKAIESEPAFDKYSATCVSLISVPLDIAIPSNLPILLMQLVEKAVRSLSLETIRHIYQLISAVGSSYLDVLSFDVITRLQDRLVEVLTKLNMDDQFGDLLCLGVLALFASRPCDPAESNRSSKPSLAMNEGLERVTDRYVSARKLFEVKRAPKTLELAVIRAIKACSESCTLRPTEICEGLRLSGEIVSACDCQERQAWVARNGGKVKKLHQKLLRADMDPGIRCGALNFLVILTDGQQLPHELIPVSEKLLLTLDSAMLSPRVLGQCIGQLHKTSVSDILLKLLRLACENNSPSSELLSQVDSALHLIATINVAIRTTPSLQEALVSSMSGERVRTLLQQFATQPLEPLDTVPGQSTLDICPGACTEALLRLQQNLTAMLLNATLHASLAETSLRSSLELLLDKQTRFSNKESRHGHHSCSSRAISPNDISGVSLFEARSTPQVDSISHDWRNEIIREMSRDARCRYQSLVRVVGEVCRDLELRCTEAERPLREEQSRSQDLRAQLEAAQMKVGELESQLQSRTNEMGSLKNERTELLAQLKTQKDGLEDLDAKLVKVRQELGQAKAHAEDAANAAVENARQQDLTYLAILTGKDEAFEEQALKLATSEAHATSLESELTGFKSEAASDHEMIESQRKAIEELNISIATAKDLAASQQTKIDQLQELESILISGREDLEKAAQGEVQRHRSKLSDLQERLQAAELGATRLQHSFDTHKAAKEAEILRLEESVRSQEETWQLRFDEACNKATLADQRRASTIAELQSKIKRLRKDREERAREFAEAQELSTRLMAVMGITKKQEGFGSTKSAGWTEERSTSSPSKPGSPSARVLDGDSAQFSDSSTSKRSGPEPKRTKRRRRSQSKGGETTRPCRVPLADLGSRQSQCPMTSMQLPCHVQSCDHQEVGSDALQEANRQLDFPDDESFDGGDIFTSTYQQPLPAMGTKLPRSTFDETTTEF